MRKNHTIHFLDDFMLVQPDYSCCSVYFLDTLYI